METKRSNFQALNKPKTHMLKTASEVSLTPSQAAEQARTNARKNPLDALSRLSLRNQGVEKRSGLQDVDDEYFKKNLFSRSNLTKYSGLNEAHEYQGHANSLAQGDAAHSQMQQHQAKQQPTPNLTQIHPISQSQQLIQQPTENAQQQQQPIHQAQMSSIQMQCKNQTYKESHLAPDSRKQQYQQPQQSVASIAEPELCTTCPNCQTTIYLVRGHETNGDPSPGSMPIQHETVGNTN